MDVGIVTLKLLAVFLLVLLNGFFVAAEFALVKIRETQLEGLIIKGNRRAKTAKWVLNHLDTSLSAAQLGITVASLVLGWIGEPVFADLLKPVFNALQIESESLRHSLAFIIGLSAITFLHIVVGEQAPKWLAIQKPLPMSLWVAQPLVWFHKISYPFIWVLNKSSLAVLRMLGIEPVSEGEIGHSEEELRLLLATSQNRGAGASSQFGRDIVLNALDLRRRIARDVMRPRSEITALDTESSIAECLDIAEKTRYSRFPLCEGGDFDKTIGVVHFKDLFAMRHKVKTAADLSSVARKIIYIPETARLEKVLSLFQEKKLHMAIVVDEYGGTTGMVTLENILEELVGQIQDEFDQEKPLLVQKDELTWEVSGALPLHELAELTSNEILEEGVTTTSGWVTQKLGGFPKPGDKVEMEGYQLSVEEMDGLKVGRLTLRKTPPVSEPAAD